MSGIWVTDCNHLVFIGEILDDALGEDIEGSTEQNIVGRVVNDVTLEVEGDITN